MPQSRVFVSYSHKDEVWKDRLFEHLGVLEQQGLLTTWDDRRIRAGQDWRQEIEQALSEAGAAVLLVSPSFLTSSFILGNEVKKLLERRQRSGMPVIPVLVRDCAWEEIEWLAKLEARPKTGKPLAFSRARRDTQLKEIAREILAITSQATLAGIEPRGRGRLQALHQLPTPPADFTGREADLAALREAIERGGVTISAIRGMGGVGKTALALQLAAELRPGYADAEIYLDLQGVSSEPLSPARAQAHVLHAFHPEAHIPEDAVELTALYRAVLHGRKTLLLMDNAASREQVEPMIPPAGSLLLITCRSHFTLPGLYSRDLGELSPAQARDLLLRIAPRIGHQAAAIASLCTGLPLAIRLAGSALAERPDLAPDAFACRLLEAKQRLSLVDASLTLSFNLLPADLRPLWCSLAVFSAPFDAAAVAAIWRRSHGAVDSALGELVRRSLVEGEEGRYRLHDLARVFAQSRLGNRRDAAAQRRHAEHFLAVLRRAEVLYLQGGDGVLRGLALFDRERTHIQEGQAWAAVHSTTDEGAAAVCSAYADAGVYCSSLRLHPRQWVAWLEAALAAARRLGNRAAETSHLGTLGIAHRRLGDTERAIALFEQHLASAREIGDRRGQANSLGNLGLVYRDLGEPHRSIEFFQQSMAFARAIGYRRGEGDALGNLGLAHVALGETHRAIELFEQHLSVAREIGDRRGEASALGNLGLAYFASADTQRAIQLFEQHIAIAREIGDRRGEANALGNLGLAHQALGESRRAIELFEQQLAISRETGAGGCEARASWNLGLALEAQGDLARAAALMESCVIYEKRIGHLEAEKHAALVEALQARLLG
jgi:tetratricopeptide (TPR) repeat protein